MADVDLRGTRSTVRQDPGDDTRLFFQIINDAGTEVDASAYTWTLDVTPGTPGSVAVPGWTAPVAVATADGSRVMTELQDAPAGIWVLRLKCDDPDQTPHIVTFRTE